jgi:peptidoglycan/LPS O-acetylase OafA/YrhL
MHKNNFDFLRLIFAVFVIITHSYPLSGIIEEDILFQITHGQTSLSYIGVRGFFVISGFLIFQSLLRSKSLTDYYWKRVLRLFPALFIVLLLTVLLGVFVYQGSPLDYFASKSVRTYIPNNLTLYSLQYHISGVFETNPYKSAINGSLWTIPYEFTLYILVSFFFFFKSKGNFIRLILIVLIIVLYILNLMITDYLSELNYKVLNAKYMSNLGLYFLIGSFMANINFKSDKLKYVLFFAAIILFILSLAFNVFNKFEFIILSVIVIPFGLLSVKYINNIVKKIGDMSYGIYIFAFPVQQTLMYYFKFDYKELMFCSLIITLLLSYFSWHLIEKRALEFKKYTPYNLIVSFLKKEKPHAK